MSGAWRFRECPRCRREFAASALEYSGTYRPGWGNGPEADRLCPGCGHKAPTSAFPVTRDTRTGYVRDTAEWRAEYARVLASTTWHKLRESVIAGQRYRCAGCGAFGGVTRSTLGLHHRHYRTLGHESPADVVALCKVCHSNADLERSRQGSARASEALYSARLTGWAEKAGLDSDDPDTAEAFDQWLEREAS
jgi:5-methylcytosine-specific restriction endonuclease McrA